MEIVMRIAICDDEAICLAQVRAVAEGARRKAVPRSRFLNRLIPPLTKGRLFVQFYLNETASFYKPI